VLPSDSDFACVPPTDEVSCRGFIAIQAIRLKAYGTQKAEEGERLSRA
jgi:hypothetical protein